MLNIVSEFLDNHTANFTTSSSVQSRMHEMLEFLDNREKIQFIKAIRGWYGSGLKEAKFMADAIWDLDLSETEINIRHLASGISAKDESMTDIRKGINTIIRNWKTLGYECVQDALIDYLNRTRA